MILRNKNTGDNLIIYKIEMIEILGYEKKSVTYARYSFFKS